MRHKLCLTALVALPLAAANQHLLLRYPTINETKIVFAVAGDLWSVPRAGGEAVRITAGPGRRSRPFFSPDGTQIAFAEEDQGNSDIYVMAAGGGLPKRLTWHPAGDMPVGWTPDSKSILFNSNRTSVSGALHLFTIRAQGGFPTQVDLPEADSGCFSADGTRMAYLPTTSAFTIWKRYRGGRTTPIWIADLATAHIEKVPRDNSNDFAPMWIGDKVFFLSDRSGAVNLYSYDLKSHQVTAVLPPQEMDIKSASAGPDAIVYARLDGIYLYDLLSKKSRRVDIEVNADMPALRPDFIPVRDQIQSAKLSPTGVRAVFEAHGEILTMPADKGDIRNITNTPAAAERYPSWSPDGTRIAYFSDASGEYQLQVKNQNGLGKPDIYDLGEPAFFYYPTWSPDSNRISYTDSRLRLWYIDLKTHKPTLIDSDTYSTPVGTPFQPSWSPDSKWIGYAKLLKNHLHAVYVYSVAENKTHQISDGMSDVSNVLFDKNGKYLYFLASTNQGLSTAWLDMSGDDHMVTSAAYLVVLSKDEPSPVAPESDEEKTPSATTADQSAPKPEDPAAKPNAAANDAQGKPEKVPLPQPVSVKMDLAGIDQRILALPIPERDYRGMDVGETGILYLRERPAGRDVHSFTEHKFDLKTRKTDKLLENITMFEVSADGKKMMLQQDKTVTVAPAGQPPKPGEGILKLDAMQVRVDPRQEYRQIYNEVWRIERDFFYDPNLHGVDWRQAAKQYAPWLENVSSREDLSYLFSDMLGELSVGHLFIRNPTDPENPHTIKTGLLGADFKIENSRYRFARVYNGENWNPQLKAPLTQPGVNVVPGEYLLAVNGREVTADANVYSFFENTAAHSVLLRVGPNPDGTGARDVTVLPVDNETGLRNLAWIEDNRRKVDRLSGGKLAYVYLPNTAEAGFTNFNRYYFAQIGKHGAVIDERFNRGGQIADYIIDNLARKRHAYFMTRTGEPFTVPQNAIFGPKAMIINEYAGSGGDAMPWLFRDYKIGPLIGKRTWGGLVGIFGFPDLIDGSGVTAPNLAFYNLKGEWDVENHGVAPDIEVENDPAEIRAGHDPQLEKAVSILMDQLKAGPEPDYQHPPFPNYHVTQAGGATHASSIHTNSR